MSLLSALFVLATPFFGFSLTPPSPSALALPVVAQLDETVDAPVDVDDASEPGTSADVAAPEPRAEASAGAGGGDEPSGARSEDPTQLSQMAAQLRQRQQMGTIHRAFGIATWAAMLVTVGLGAIQYYNLYGFGGSISDNPCVNGDAVFGQDQCFGTPWAHRIAALTTTALYATTFALSFVMPDPLGASEGAAGADLELHKTLRWVHLGGMVAQILLGFMVGQNWFGLDRANHFGELQAIATVHQVVGLATFGVLTAAGAIMVF